MIFGLCLSLVAISGITAQSTDAGELSSLVWRLTEAPSVSVTSEFDRRSELSMLAHAGVRIYQLVLSSQDYSVCQFIPTCSRFSDEVIRRRGLWKGLLLTSDRLQRCHGFPGSADYYNWTPDRRKRYDPVDKYDRTNEIFHHFQ